MQVPPAGEDPRLVLRLLGREIQIRFRTVQPQRFDSFQRGRTIGPHRNLGPDRTASQRIRIGRHPDPLASVLLDQQDFVAGHVLVPVPQRDGGIGALHPEGVPVLFQRNRQHHVIHLADGNIAREQGCVRGAHGIIIRLHPHGRQGRTQKIGKGLAVSEAAFIHGRCREGLQAADAELDAHVTGIIPQIAVQHGHLFLRCLAILRHLPELRHRFVRQVLRPFLQAVQPQADIFPVALGAGLPAIAEFHGRGIDIGYEGQERWHQMLFAETVRHREFPLIAVGLSLFHHRFSRCEILNGKSSRNNQGVRGAHQRHVLPVQRQKRRERGDAFFTGNRIVIFHRKRIRRCGLIQANGRIVGQAVCQGMVDQIVLPDLPAFSLIGYGTAEGSHRVKGVRIFPEGGGRQAFLIMHQHFPVYRILSAYRRRQFVYQLFGHNGRMLGTGLQNGEQQGRQQGQAFHTAFFFRTSVVLYMLVSISYQARTSLYASVGAK